MTLPVIAIDGIDGSGKSHFRRRLVAAFARRGHPLLSLPVDDFRRPVDWVGACRGGRSESDAYYDDYYDFAAIEQALAAIAGGARVIEVPVFDRVREQIGAPRRLEVAGTAAIVVEGVFTLRIRSVERAFLIYLDTSFEEARRRILARDRQVGRTAADIARRIDRRYFPSQRRYLAEHAPRQRAAVVIDNEDFAAPRARRVTFGGLPATLQPALEEVIP